jgi:O-antigen ligase
MGLKRRRISWIEALPAIATFGVVLIVGLAGGGFFPRTWRFTLLALLLLSAAALVARDRITFRRREWVALTTFGALTAWTAASSEWSSLPTGSLIESERTLLYTVALLTVLVGVAASSLPHILLGALAGVTGVSAYALGRHVLSPPPPDPFQGTHLHEPFGYSNAIGIFLVLGIVLAIGLSVAARSPAARLAVLAPLLVLLPTLYLTSSRGAWVALPVGVAASLYVGGAIRSRAVLLSLLAVGIAVAVVIGSERGQPFTLFGENRPHYWRVAWQDFEANPILGSGAGTFGAFWLEHRPVDEFVHDAHSLFLESLAELGSPGLALLVVGFGVPLVALRRRQDPFVAAAAGAYVAFLLHAAVDWDWEFGAVGLVGVGCAAAVLVGTRPERTQPISIVTRGLLLLAVVVLAAFVVARLARSA